MIARPFQKTQTPPTPLLLYVSLIIPAFNEEDGISAVIERALLTNREHCVSPFTTLAALGGLEIAGLCGLCLGAAAHKIAVVVDGFISSSAALVAMRLCPAAKDYMFFAHMSVTCP